MGSILVWLNEDSCSREGCRGTTWLRFSHTKAQVFVSSKALYQNPKGSARHLKYFSAKILVFIHIISISLPTPFSPSLPGGKHGVVVKTQWFVKPFFKVLKYDCLIKHPLHGKRT